MYACIYFYQGVRTPCFIVGNNIISKDMFSIKCYNKKEKKNKESNYNVVKDT